MKRKTIQLSEEIHGPLEHMAKKYSLTKKEVAELSIMAIFNMALHPNEVKRDQIAKSIKEFDEKQQAFIKRMEQGPLSQITYSVDQTLQYSQTIHVSLDNLIESFSRFMDLLAEKEQDLQSKLESNMKYNRDMKEVMDNLYDNLGKDYSFIRTGGGSMGDKLRRYLIIFLNGYEELFNIKK